MSDSERYPALTIQARCFSLYLLMDAPRPLTIFHKQLEDWRFDGVIDFMPPPIDKLRAVAKAQDWKKAAAAYDAEVARRMQIAQAEAVAEGRFNFAHQLETFAAKAMTAADAKIYEADAPGLVYSSIAALKQAAVLRGGVSDRTTLVVDDQAAQARRAELDPFSSLIDVTPPPGVKPVEPAAKAITNGAQHANGSGAAAADSKVAT